MKNVVYEPLGDRILVKVAAATSKIGMLEIPNAVQETPNYGTVVAVGDPNSARLDVGEIVLYNKYGGFSIYHDKDNPMVVLRPADLICRVHGKDEDAQKVLQQFIETGDKSLFDPPKNPMEGSLFDAA